MCKCFKCEKQMSSAVAVDNDDNVIWETPLDGVVMTGGHNFGSGIYDSLVDGISIRVILCDACLRKAKLNKELLKEDNINSQHQILKDMPVMQPIESTIYEPFFTEAIPASKYDVMAMDVIKGQTVKTESINMKDDGHVTGIY